MDRAIHYQNTSPANSPQYMVIQTRKWLGYQRFYGPFPIWKGMLPSARAKVLEPFQGTDYVLEVIRWTAASDYQKANATLG